jgi:hypothetical protein
MSTSTTNQKALRVSYAAFFVALAAFLYFCSRFAPNKGEISFVPITAVFAAAFGWQVFATLRNRQNLLCWILAVLYALAIAAFVVEMLRFPSARQLWWW